ncbi:ACT domain-containing protein [Antrihabitans sp. YC2-6]|uniref:ACT domain-containing protein n=1 Tax=Antrihabitans sp. YC2-6 TaxID=2799498 RepID=UPI0018F71E32|nr:ACT domain-containing protein [Antrihabitans sp. YC2-6]MBJ8343809.1 ACT domain-containing protein [Antrihabitans sp. YC2-6]
MTGERDLTAILATLQSSLRAGTFVFVSVTDADDIPFAARIEEAEGITLVVDRSVADARQLAYDFVAHWITLDVHSSLQAVGLTAAVSSALTAAGISCNVLAGFYHDHLLVPADRIDDALAVLDRLRTER